MTTVAASALCASLAACLDIPKPRYPVSRQEPAAEAPPVPEAPQPAPAPAPPQQDNAPQAKPTTGIQAQPLAPPAGARTPPPRGGKTSSSSPSPGAWLEPRYGGAHLWLAAYAEPVVRQAAARDGDTVTLKKGDSLEALAKARGVAVEDLAKANDLKPPYRIKAGDRLHMPSKVGAEPAPTRAKGRGRAEAAQAKPASGGSVTVAKGDSLASISKKTGVPVEDLARINGLDSPDKLKLGQVLALNGEAKAPAPSKADSAKPEPARPEATKSESPKADKASGGSVTVGKGDTLGSIAKKAGVSIEDLARINGLKKPYRLDAGQTISLGEAASDAPAKGGKAKAPEPEAAAEPDSTSTVTAGRRDTLQSLARQAHVSVEALARLNHLKPPYRLHRGQQIKLPDEGGAGHAPASSASPPAETTTSVKAGRGDTLATIARKHGVTVEDLASLNHLKPGARLKRGQSIRIPGGEAEPAPSGPESIVAGRRDTLKSLADKAGVSVEALARANHIKPSARTKRGQRLKLPEQESSAATSYRVQGGDTLFSIARRFGTDPGTLARLNRMDVSESLKVGQRLALPGGAEDQIAPRPARPRPEAAYAPPPPASQPSGPVPYSSLPSNPPAGSAPGLASPEPLPEPSTPSPAPTPPGSAPPSPTPYVRPTAPPDVSPPTASDADAAAAGRGLFQWPIRGQVLSGFGPKAGGQRNDGMDIAGASGDPVRAAAAGEVVYAGNSIPGFGNLILIRHEGGWVTAYAHLANLDVKMRQTVGQGQQIGEVGQTGGVDRPLLHFEVRYAPAVKDKPRPIDPALVLPQ